MTLPFNLFTKDSQRILKNAQTIAKQNKQPTISSEHLLLGLLYLDGNQAERALEELRLFKIDHLKTRLEAHIKLAAKEKSQLVISYNQQTGGLTGDSIAIIEAAHAEAQENGLNFIDTRLLIIGMLRQPQSGAGQILGQYGVTLPAFREKARLGEVDPIDVKSHRRVETNHKPRQGVNIGGISFNFIIIVALTIISAALLYLEIGNSTGYLFLFVTAGWVVSLALHEFGHALVAYFGGDDSVVDKGYLTLDPFKYTHPVLSIVFPIIFLIMGGIGLPGGAVYINRNAIKNNAMHSLISAAGPLANLIFAFILAIPFWLDLHRTLWEGHQAFWQGLAFLLFLQIIAIALNLIPLPGLDGYGIVEPFLPPDIARLMNTVRPYAFMILLFFFLVPNPFISEFFNAVSQAIAWFNPDLPALAGGGFGLFRFWE